MEADHVFGIVSALVEVEVLAHARAGDVSERLEVPPGLLVDVGLQGRAIPVKRAFQCLSQALPKEAGLFRPFGDQVPGFGRVLGEVVELRSRGLDVLPPFCGQADQGVGFVLGRGQTL